MKETYNPEQHIDTDISQKQEKTNISPSDKTWECPHNIGIDCKFCYYDKIANTQEDKDWKEAEKLGIECPHGNYIGWCKNCSKKWTTYIKQELTSVTIKAKEEYKEAILGEIDAMFDGYIGVETITINELEGIMKKHLEEPNSCR